MILSYSVRKCPVSKTAAKSEAIDKGKKEIEEVSNGCSGEF